MKDKILIFIITYKASFRVLDVIRKIPFKYLKNKNYKDDTLDYLDNIIKEISNVNRTVLPTINNARAVIKNTSYGKAVNIDPFVSTLLKTEHPQIIVVLNSVGVVLPKSQIPNPYPGGNYQTCYLFDQGNKFYLSKTRETININEYI